MLACGSADAQMMENGQVIPIPDPTVRTSQEIDGQIKELRLLIEARLNGMDEANKISLKNIENEIQAAAQLEQEKIRTVEEQILDRDTRSNIAREDRTNSVAEQIQSQKEAFQLQNAANSTAIEKSEAGFTKEIDSLKTLIDTYRNAETARLNELNDRITRSEASNLATHDVRVDDRSGTTTTVAVVGGGLAVVSLLVTGVGMLISSRPRSPNP